MNDEMLACKLLSFYTPKYAQNYYNRNELHEMDAKTILQSISDIMELDYALLIAKLANEYKKVYHD